MKNLTKKQRHDVYVQVLEKLNSPEIFGGFVCNIISSILCNDKENITKKTFPELFLFKRNVSYPFLAISKKSPTYQDDNLRRVVIEFCIQMTK